ncbi:hypothetical protein EG827_01880 [bacterium]|nr:hypothetical protein [bacterium]
MKKILFNVIFLTLIFSKAEAQEFIGLPEDNIREIMKADRPGLNMDTRVKNSTFRYIKYSSGDDKETWLIFIDEKGRCNGVRITCDNICYESKTKELNDLYRSDEPNIWVYKSGGDEIIVRLKQESWFFTVTYERKKHTGKSGNDRTA